MYVYKEINIRCAGISSNNLIMKTGTEDLVDSIQTTFIVEKTVCNNDDDYILVSKSK